MCLLIGIERWCWKTHSHWWSWYRTKCNNLASKWIIFTHKTFQNVFLIEFLKLHLNFKYTRYRFTWCDILVKLNDNQKLTWTDIGNPSPINQVAATINTCRTMTGNFSTLLFAFTITTLIGGGDIGSLLSTLGKPIIMVGATIDSKLSVFL